MKVQKIGIDECLYELSYKGRCISKGCSESEGTRNNLPECPKCGASLIVEETEWLNVTEETAPTGK